MQPNVRQCVLSDEKQTGCFVMTHSTQRAKSQLNNRSD